MYIQCNLIEAYDQLMDFVARHLPDKFHLQGDQRISLRTRIFREVVANIIIHREYMNAHPTTFIIYRDRVETVNANNPHGNGLLLPDTFIPFPKNPIIAKFFIQLGRVDELGSGIINVYEYLKYYSPDTEPQFIEDRLFKTVIPLPVDKFYPKLHQEYGANFLGEEALPIYGESDAVNRKSDAVNTIINETAGRSVNRRTRERLLEELAILYQEESLSSREIQNFLSIQRNTAQRDIKLLKDADLVRFVGSAKTGKYQLTKKAFDIFQ